MVFKTRGKATSKRSVGFVFSLLIWTIAVAAAGAGLVTATPNAPSASAGAKSLFDKRPDKSIHPSAPATDDVMTGPKRIKEGPSDPSGIDATLAYCHSCHGSDGQGISSAYPTLAGQHSTYLYRQLLAFKSSADPQRPSAIMTPLVADLDAADLVVLAKTFSSMPARVSMAKNIDSVEAGRSLWRAGNSAIGIPSCMGCHGPNGLGIAGTFPRLAGQYKEYVTMQLSIFRSQTRTSDANAMMRRLAERMTDREIESVANFVEGLRE